MERRNFLKTLLAAGAAGAALPGTAHALRYFPRKKSMQKWAVLFSTWTGSSRDAAVWIADGMGGIADVYDLREMPNLMGYDHIVLGGSIRWEKVSPDLQQYIKDNRGWLRNKIRGLFVVCGNYGRLVGQKQKEQYIDNHLARLAGVYMVPVSVFAGRMTKSLLEKQAWDQIKKQETADNPIKDYDNLSRKECMQYGKNVFDRTMKQS